jgi:hypothetical protein
MRTLIIIVAALAPVATQADARHRRHGGYRFESPRFERGVIEPRFERGVIERGLVERSYGRRGAPETRSPETRSYDRTRSKIAALIPRDWRREEPEQKQSGSRFVSPAGDAWLAFYATPADQEPVDQHWKVVAYADGEELNYLQREPSWVAVSGFKGERMFYRKAVLACGGRQWRHVAFEHPAVAKRDFDPLVTQMARALDREVEENCDTTVGREVEPAR